MREICQENAKAAQIRSAHISTSGEPNFRSAENFGRNAGFVLVLAENENESVSAEIFMLQKEANFWNFDNFKKSSGKIKKSFGQNIRYTETGIIEKFSSDETQKWRVGSPLIFQQCCT